MATRKTPATLREAADAFDLDAWLAGLREETVVYEKLPGVPEVRLAARTGEWAEQYADLQDDELRVAYVAGHIVTPAELGNPEALQKAIDAAPILMGKKLQELNLVCVQLDTMPDGVSPHFLRRLSA